MATSTFPLIVASVLAASLIDEFDITRAQVGLLATASALVGAVFSPYLGRVADRVGAVKAVAATLLAGAVALTLFALSPNYALLFTAALITGLPNGMGNPSTNSLIVENLAVGSRGVVTGLKQSGVQFGTFLGGLLLPVLASVWNWRVAVAAFVAMPVAGLFGLVGRSSDRARRRFSAAGNGGELPSTVRRIAVYGFLSGVATSAITQFIPLFAEEDQFWSETAAGSVVAVVGLAGIFSRIFWSRFAERAGRHGATLRTLSLMTAVAGLLLALAAGDLIGSWILIPVALLVGLGAIAWNAVGMLAVMELAPPDCGGEGDRSCPLRVPVRSGRGRTSHGSVGRPHRDLCPGVGGDRSDPGSLRRGGVWREGQVCPCLSVSWFAVSWSALLPAPT